MTQPGGPLLEAPVDAEALGSPGVAPPPDLAARARPKGGADVLKLVSGATVAQIVSVAVSPILSRLYAPEAVGLSTLFNSMTGILTVVICLRYELSIVLPEKDEEAAHLLGASLLFAFATSLLTVPAVIFGRASIVRLLRSPELGSVLWLVPPMVLLTGIFVALNYWNSRVRQFGRVAIARLSSATTTSVVQVSAGLAGNATGLTLVGATVFGNAVATGVLTGQVLADDRSLLRRALSWSGIRDGIRRHKKFPVYGTGSALLNQISWQLPAFMLQGYFSAAVVGLYALGNRVLKMPMSLVGNAIGQVFYQRAAESNRKGTLAETVEGTFRRLVVFSLLPVIVLTLIGRDAFGLVFGSRWSEAGSYAQILAPWTFVWFISSPLSTVFAVLEKQEFGLKIDTLIFSTRVASLVIGGRLHDARLAMILFSASGLLVYGYYLLAILKVSGVDLGSVFRFLSMRLLEYLPAIAVLVALKAVAAPAWILVAAGVALLAVYAVLVARRDPAMSALWRSVFRV